MNKFLVSWAVKMHYNGLYMESCEFVSGEFPQEIQTQAKEQLTLIKLKIAIFYIRCWR